MSSTPLLAPAFAALQEERSRSWSSDALAANAAQRRALLEAFDPSQTAAVGNVAPDARFLLVDGGETTLRDLVARGPAVRRDSTRTTYFFDVRTEAEYADGHIPGFRHYPGGQLVQETDMAAPVRGAQILVADDLGTRADMTASWLAQMGWDVFVLEGGFDGSLGALQTGPAPAVTPIPAADRYKRPYEGTDNGHAAMQAYLDWEYGLLDQLRKDNTHGFVVI